jgi:hypothetical protein
MIGSLTLLRDISYALKPCQKIDVPLNERSNKNRRVFFSPSIARVCWGGGSGSGGRSNEIVRCLWGRISCHLTLSKKLITRMRLDFVIKLDNCSTLSTLGFTEGRMGRRSNPTPMLVASEWQSFPRSSTPKIDMLSKSIGFGGSKSIWLRLRSRLIRKNIFFCFKVWEEGKSVICRVGRCVLFCIGWE